MIRFQQQIASSTYSNSAKVPTSKLGLLFPFLFLLTIISCKVEPIIPEPDPLYSFFIAGHTYGHIDSNNVGLHPPFEAKFPMINNDPFLEMGFLTGDMVRFPTEQDWEEVDSAVSKINMPVHYVAGNHDMKDPELYEERYGKGYFHFTHNQDLFIVLNANIEEWLIDEEQLNYLKTVVSQEASSAENIYVLFHQLLWWSPTNEFSRLNVNNVITRPDTVNFWAEIEPIFNSLPNNVVMLAGDLGAHFGYFWPSYFYYAYDNITFVASGMGNFQSDNFIIVDVMPDKSIQYRLIALNGDDINALGKLEDYRLP